MMGVQNSGKAKQSIRIAVIGDVHDQWETADNQALERLKVDLALFVGDFGNEAVEVVRTIAAANVPKAVILGNHDAWYSASDWGRKKSPYDHAVEDRVQRQLDLLGATHVGYGKLELPALGLTVVGGRPFSWGGNTWKNPEFYQKRYQIQDFAASTQRIVSHMTAADHETLIVISHCGPRGLGDQPESTCGQDWHPIGGDHGDPDLAAAIAQGRDAGKAIPLVVFGHMHHTLRHRHDRLRDRWVQDPQGTGYLNAASVPRFRDSPQGRLRNFSIATLHQQHVIQAALVWANEQGQIHQETRLYEAHDYAEIP